MVLIGLLFFVLSFPSAWASVVSDARMGNQLYKEGKFEDSIQYFKKASVEGKHKPVVDYDLGAAYYKIGDYKKAADQWGAVLQAKRPDLHLKASYNLGNALYKEALTKENKELDAAIAQMEQAVSTFASVKDQDAKDKDAADNYDAAKKELERLKRKQQQQQESQNNSKEGKSKDNKDQDQQQKSQEQQDKQEQKQQQQESGQKQQEGQEKQQEDKASKPQGQAGQEGKDKTEQAEQAEQGEAQTPEEEIQKQEAKALLQEYERNEQPKQMLHFVTESTEEKPVSKDW